MSFVNPDSSIPPPPPEGGLPGTSSGSVTFGNLVRINGYRPIEVTLTFKDGSQAVPDSVGAPVLGSVYAVGPEILTEATVNATIQQSGLLAANSNQITAGTATKPIQAFTVAQPPIIQSARGAAIRLYWHNPSDPLPSSGDIPISPGNISINSQLGYVEVAEAAPQGKTSCVAYYYSEVSENNALLLQGDWISQINSLGVSSSGFSTAFGLSQVYPVTRNKTDYLFGTKVQLRPPNLDRTSPDYYPVFEYRQEPDGSLTFAVPLHKYSDTPASIQVKYQTLALQPRIIVDLIRGQDVGISPEVPPLQIAVQTVTT